MENTLETFLSEGEQRNNEEKMTSIKSCCFFKVGRNKTYLLFGENDPVEKGPDCWGSVLEK